MSPSDYKPPVAALLDAGEIDFRDSWHNYPQEFGLDNTHIPDLIRMATDLSLGEGYGPIHAWRTLGQLQATEAITPLLEFFNLNLDDDWIHEDIPKVMGWMGAAAVSELQSFLENPSHDEMAHIAAMESFKYVVKHDPQCRSDCMDVLKQQLESFEKNTPSLNGFLMAALLDLHAVELAPLMKQVFDAKCVDFTIVGDWDEVQVSLGFKSRREVPLRGFTPTEAFELDAEKKRNLKELMRFASSGKGFAPAKSPSKPPKNAKKKKR